MSFLFTEMSLKEAFFGLTSPLNFSFSERKILSILLKYVIQHYYFY